VFDGDDVLSGGDDQSARRWSVADRTVRQSFTGHTAAVLDVARNDAHIATVCADANLRLYPRSTAPEQLAVKELAPAATFKHPTVVRTVAAIGSQFVTGSDDSLLRRWDPKVGELERLSGHAGQILSLAACPDGRFVSGATDNTARRWTPAVVDAVAIDSAQGVKLAGSVDGKTLAVVGRSPERLSIWRVAEGLERIAGPLDLPAATDVVAIHAEAGLVTTAAAAELSVWNLTDLKKLTAAVTQAAPVAGLAFLQHGKRLTVASGPMLFHYDVAREGDAASLSLRHDAVGHANNIVALGAAPDDRTLWTAAQDNVVRVFSSAAPTPRHVLADATGPAYSAAYSADGRWLATGGADGTLRIWNAATGELAHRAAAQAAAINQVAFSVAGELLVTGSEDGIVRIWKVSAPPVSAEPLAANVEPLHEWICADGDKRRPVRSILISADLNWVLAGTSHGAIFVWKTQDPAAEPLKLEAHNASITALRFSPANSRLASFDAAGHAAIWTPGNWAYLAFQRLPSGVTTGAYGPDGVTWITGDRKGSVRIVPVTPSGR
jgi:WD40 repeat protein